MTHRQRYQRQSDLFVPKTPLVPMTASERDEAIATGERALVRNTQCRRSDGGRR